jgi:arabinogalactan endo-1,4-beta-galactosidase
MTVAVAGAGIGLALPATALYGEAEITPVESNLAQKYWTSVTATGGTETAELAVDQNPGTAWVASAPGDALTLDLGGAYENVRKVSLEFPDAGAVYRYTVEVSSDATTWQAIADESGATAASAGGVHLFTAPGTRYVRVTMLAASGGARLGISNLAVHNFLRDDMILGADLSWVDNDRNREYWVSPLEEDRGAGPHLLDVVKDRGMDYVRLRIFNEPRSEGTGALLPIPYQGPERSLESASWIVERDMRLGIDFHYADSWADPGKQPKPRAWAELEFDELTEAVYDYTHDYLTQLVDQGTTPEKVAIGNEILHGMLWGSEAQLATEAGPPVWSGANPAYFRNQPEIYQSQPGGGILWQYWQSDDPAEHQLYLESFDRFATLVASGVAAVRDASPESKVELHSIVRRGGIPPRTGLEMGTEFWDQLLSRLEADGLPPDVLALSYYPEWHGTPETLERNLQTISALHPDYEVMVTETSYPASGGGGSPLPNSPYPRTVQGQADAIQRVFEIVNDMPDNKGVGVLTWEPHRWQAMFRAVPGLANTSEPHASIDVYNKSAATHVLQDRVFVAAEPGESPSLPDTVDVLRTADGHVLAAEVTWQSSGVLADEGRVTVHGTTEHGPVTAYVDVVREVDVLPAVTLAAAARCHGPNAFLSMTARNGGDVPVSVDFDSEFGSRSVRTLQPGREAEKLLPALQRSVQQGAVLATLSFDGTTVDVAAPYAAIACR